MALTDLEQQQVKNIVGDFCRRRNRPDMKHLLELKYTISGQDVILFERRPHWKTRGEWIKTPVAKMKFVRSAREWRLFWMRADLKWHRYDPYPSTSKLEDLVEEVSRDPHACFFG